MKNEENVESVPMCPLSSVLCQSLGSCAGMSFILQMDRNVYEFSSSASWSLFVVVGSFSLTHTNVALHNSLFILMDSLRWVAVVESSSLTLSSSLALDMGFCRVVCVSMFHRICGSSSISCIYDTPVGFILYFFFSFCHLFRLFVFCSWAITVTMAVT